MPYVDMANIACGFHASDPQIMSATVALALKYGVSIGAHPGYLDKLGFGRRKMDLPTAEIQNLLLYQIGSLQAICQAQGAAVDYVKPHGALYHAMMADNRVLSAIIEALAKLNPKIPLIVMANNRRQVLEHLAAEQGIPLIFEAFADRVYDDQGSLLSRSEAGALQTDPKLIEQQVINIVRDQYVVTHTGNKISLSADTLCVHGDNNAAIESIKQIRQLLNVLSL